MIEVTRGTRGTDTFDPIINTTGAERMKRFSLSLAAAQDCTHRTVQPSLDAAQTGNYRTAPMVTVTCENCPVMVRGRPAADFFACHLVSVTKFSSCECCGGTGKIRESEFVDGDVFACMTCNGSGKA